jgi:hypothetical protein
VVSGSRSSRSKAGSGSLDYVALALGQRAAVLGLGIEVEPVGSGDPQIGEIELGGRKAALERLAVFALHRGRAVIVLEDDVDHPLIGRIAVPQRHFLGQNLDLLDRFGRVGLDLAEARHAHSVDQQRREPAAAPTARSGLGCKLLQQLGQRAGAVSGDVLRLEHLHRRLRRIDLALEPFGQHHDLFVVAERFLIPGLRHVRRRSGLALRPRLRRNAGNGCDARQQGRAGEFHR